MSKKVFDFYNHTDEGFEEFTDELKEWLDYNHHKYHVQLIVEVLDD